MMWQGVDNAALQYVVFIGGTYILTASIAVFIFASRLFTNRTAKAGTGKPYIPVEPGEVGKSVRKIIANQFVRSAMVAWESRPRDLLGEILQAEEHGVLPAETSSVGRNDYLVGREIPIDPASPPWGDIQHRGWSSPTQSDENDVPHLQFDPVVEELPNLIEARAVSLAPPDPLATPTGGTRPADPVVFELLRRPETMGMRDYLTQLSYLGLVNPPEVGQSFLHQYEYARFNGLPISNVEFKSLMSAFADLLSGMTHLEPEIIEQIRAQTGNGRLALEGEEEISPDGALAATTTMQSSPPRTPDSSIISPVTARTAPSRSLTPYLQQDVASEESFSSVVRQTPEDDNAVSPETERRPSQASSSLEGEESESGSVLRHSPSPDTG